MLFVVIFLFNGLEAAVETDDHVHVIETMIVRRGVATDHTAASESTVSEAGIEIVTMIPIVTESGSETVNTAAAVVIKQTR